MKHPSLRAHLRAKLPQLVFFLCIMQPTMDVLSFWLDRAGISNTPTLFLRLAVLGFLLLTGFVLSERRRYYYGTAGLLLVFTLCHCAFCMQGGYLDPVGDITNLIRIYQLPLTTLVFITYLRQDRRCLAAIQKGFFWCLVIIFAVELVSVATGTNPYTYPNKSVGVLGWFYFANAQSVILSMLTPVALVYVLEKKNYNPAYALVSAIISFGILFFFATRLAYASLIATGLGLFLSLLLLKCTRKIPAGRAAAVIFLCMLLAVGCYRLSPMVKNNRMVAENAVLKQADVDALVEKDEAAAKEAGLTGQALSLQRLRSAYEKYLPGPTGRFGLERTAEVYDFSTDIQQIGDFRLEKLNYCRMLLEDSPQSRYFGLELQEMTYDGLIYDAENDFHGIYYLCGGVGLVLICLFLLWFLLRICTALFRDFKNTFTLEAAGFGIALCCCLAHAYFTAGVLRRPNASFFMAVVLSAIYALTAKDAQKANDPVSRYLNEQ